jgi:hypothetical protein
MAARTITEALTITEQVIIIIIIDAITAGIIKG